ncbi:MAG: hypothetical protein RL186_879, partial [Pseudomonadota bacterium]
MTKHKIGWNSRLQLGAWVVSAVALAGCATTTTTTPTPANVPPPAIHLTHDNSLRIRTDAAAAALQDGVNKSVAAGFAIALTDSNGNTEKAVVGLADRETNRAIDNDTIYRLYSMTKPVTAVAIMQLVERGKIDLDAPVATYIPSFAKAKVYVSGDTPQTLVTAALERPLTVRDLMRQTAGMPYIGKDKPVERLYVAAGIERAPGEPVPGMSGQRVTSLQELADRIAATPLSSQPGAAYTYGNAIDVLGRVVEIASGQTLGAYFKANIFDPLGMSHTGFNVAPADAGKLASGYFTKSPKPITMPFLAKIALADVPASTLTLADAGATSIFNAPARLEFGGSGLVGSLDDYVRFARMIAHAGTLDGAKILSATSIADMGRDQLSAPASERLRQAGSTYGLGFGV